MATFAERLYEALEAREMKPIELSEKTGIGKSSISQYLSGRNNPNGRNILKIAQALRVDENWLMGADIQMDRKTDEQRKSESEAVEDEMSKMMIDRITAYYNTLSFGEKVHLFEVVRKEEMKAK